MGHAAPMGLLAILFSQFYKHYAPTELDSVKLICMPFSVSIPFSSGQVLRLSFTSRTITGIWGFGVKIGHSYVEVFLHPAISPGAEALRAF